METERLRRHLVRFLVYAAGQEVRQSLAMFPRNQTVGQFLQLARDRTNNPDLCAVWLDGILLPEPDLFDDWFDPTHELQVTEDDLIPPDPAPFDRPLIQQLADDVIPPDIRLRFTSNPSADVMSAREDHFTVFTTTSLNSMIHGHPLDIDRSLTVTGVRAKVVSLIRDSLPTQSDLHIFLPGGLPFMKGTLNDYFKAVQVDCPKRLYVVVTVPLGRSVETIVNDYSSPTIRTLLSPLYESTAAGIRDVVTLLTSFQHNVANSERLLLILAKFTGFSPLIVNLFRLMENAELTGLNVVAITGPLYTFLCEAVLNWGIARERVLEYTIKSASYLCEVGTDLNCLSIYAGNWDDGTDENDIFEYFAKKFGHQRHFVIWERDTSSTSVTFEMCEFSRPKFEDIDRAPLFSQ
jgi:hypothetical protein